MRLCSTVIAGWWRWRVVASVAGWPWRRRHCRAPIETTELSLEASATHCVDDGGGSAGSGGRSIWPAHVSIYFGYFVELKRWCLFGF